MHNTLAALFYYIFDAIIPPRGSELKSRRLSLDELYALSNASGALPYRNPRVRALVWELKYRASPRAAKLAGAFLADELLALASDIVGTPLLIPVPMHAERRAQRGHNQTEVLCEAALHFLKPQKVFEYHPKALARVRQTRPQQGLMRGKRLRNVTHSMQASAEAVRGRACVVVDDVSTTGATLSEARRALLSAGASEVHCVTLTVTA